MTTHVARSLILATVICVAAAAAQAGRPALPPEGLQAETPVDPHAALAEARRALAGRAVHAAFEGRDPGFDIVMNGNGGPRLLRMGGSDPVLLYYTGRTAVTCAGGSTERELVLEYRQRTATAPWSVQARTRSDIEVLMPVFQMLAGEGDIESEASTIAQSESIALARTRPMPLGQQQASTPLMQEVLELDVRTSLPSRWYVRVPSTGSTPYVMTFAYPDESFTVPAVSPPTCVP
jgi:hypothetical protein